MSAESDLYKNLLDQLQACATQEERDWLALRFSIFQLPEPLRAAVETASVPRVFDRAFLNTLLEQPLDEGQFAELTGLSYIEPYPCEGRFNVHERSRKLLQEKLWQENEALYREISRRAFVYCKKQDQNNLTWRIETVYHQLVAEPEASEVTLNDSCMQWFQPSCFAFNKVESLLRAVREHLDMQRLSEKAVQYYWLHQARVDRAFSRFQEAQRALQQISLAVMPEDHYLAISRLKSIGHTHRYLSELTEAQQCYEEALLLHRKRGNQKGEAECFTRLGEVYLRRSNFSAAKQNIEEALTLYRNTGKSVGEAECLKYIGHVHLHLGEYLSAKQCYNEALSLYREASGGIGEADCLRSLGDVHRSLLTYDEAQLLCEQALILYRKKEARLGEANSLKSLGQVYLRRSEFKEARLLYEESLQIYRKIGLRMGEADCLRLFGDLSVQTGEWTAAWQYYDQALALSENIQRPEGVAECWEGFAKLHQVQHQLPQAEEYWQKAADMYRQLTMPLRTEHCLEQLRRMKEQKQPADERDESSINNG